ncbi:MAG: IS21 family transposase [Dehalococcoidia bacterium]|nr:IS21 family transposase [Dehalococcoidia bacterium]
MTDYREMLRLGSLGLNRTQIADSLGVSRTTVIHTLQRAAARGLDWRTVETLSDRELADKLLPKGGDTPGYQAPDYAYIHREMAKPGMTQQLLWMEYCDHCRDAGTIPYQLTQFKKRYREHLATTKATMHINRKPGEIMEVDWAGQTAQLVDSDTGEVQEAYVFVAALPYSGYAYAEAFLSRDQQAWTAAHVNAYEYFGGVARILVPDNLKTGVIKHTRNEVVLNKSYHEMAEHYGTAILPARVNAPRDKATVEGTVGYITRGILAAIRNQMFFTLREMNGVIKERLYAVNHKPFRDKDGSRATWFAEERVSLLPLPSVPFELSEWKAATVSFNYHIGVDEQYYSVPYEYIKRKVDVRLTRNVVEIFYEGTRICSHIRIHGRRGQYSTQEAHMPANHQKSLQWNGERFRKWAAKIGPCATTTVEAILTGYKVEQQGYRACMALLKLSDQYTPDRLEAACAKALTYTPRPNYKAIQTILKSGQDRITKDSAAPAEPSVFGFTRGADYYKGGNG